MIVGPWVLIIGGISDLYNVVLININESTSYRYLLVEALLIVGPWVLIIGGSLDSSMLG